MTRKEHLQLKACEISIMSEYLLKAATESLNYSNEKAAKKYRKKAKEAEKASKYHFEMAEKKY